MTFVSFPKNLFHRLHYNAKPAFLNSFALKSVFEKLSFRDGLVWTVDLTVKIKLCFQISPTSCGRDLKRSKYTIKAKQWKANLASDDSKTSIIIYLLGMEASDDET